MWSLRLAAALVLPALATPLATPVFAAGRPDTITRFAGTAGLAQLAADARGGLVAADPSGDRVVRIAPDGAVTVVAGGPEAGLDAPEGVAVRADGAVYVSDARHRVTMITPDGRTRTVAGSGVAGAPVPGPALSSPLSAPAGLAVDRAGNLFIADEHAVLRVSPSGTLSIAAEPTDSRTVAVDSLGNLYVSVPDCGVERIAADGVRVAYAGTGCGHPTPGPARESRLDAFEHLSVDDRDNLVLATDDGVAIVAPDGTLSLRGEDVGGVRDVRGEGAGGVRGEGVGRARDLRGEGAGGVRDVRGEDVDGVRDVRGEGAGGVRDVRGQGAGGVRDVHGDGAGGVRDVRGQGAGGMRDVRGEDVDGVRDVRGEGVEGVRDVRGEGAGDVRGERVRGRSAVASSTGAVFVGGVGGVARIGPATPSAPQDLRITPRDRSLELSFRAPLDAGADPVAGYQVSLDGSQTWRPLATEVDGDRLTGSVAGLDNGVQYAVLVSARNAAGASPGSVILPAVPGASFLAVTGTDVAVFAWTGLFAVLVGIGLVVAGAVDPDCLPTRTRRS
ncbi:fibronectin type III domain-containing protein [Dactylosporangium sp. CA-139114]|uniref:fibronectin type III domain-containing protein n=1 Tax=Dactylosporangium sp. CA-139114 TaxID=3239931 RepID=UPI003D98F911